MKNHGEPSLCVRTWTLIFKIEWVKSSPQCLKFISTAGDTQDEKGLLRQPVKEFGAEVTARGRESLGKERTQQCGEWTWMEGTKQKENDNPMSALRWWPTSAVCQPLFWVFIECLLPCLSNEVDTSIISFRDQKQRGQSEDSDVPSLQSAEGVTDWRQGSVAPESAFTTSVILTLPLLEE